VGFASVLGVALGVAALIVVLSVMNGFENELRGRLVTITGHAAVLTGGQGDDWRELRDELGAWPGIVAAAFLMSRFRRCWPMAANLPVS
jgi:lipoprotein-releasing system permease protein